MVTGLRRQHDRAGDPPRLLEAYRDDPFDPHAIAELRPVAYRRAVVMAYVDNLLDWGDMLFRQYTAESIDEARMLYVLAHDLLGAPPEQLGTQLPPDAESFALPRRAGRGRPGPAHGLRHRRRGAHRRQRVHASVASAVLPHPGERASRATTGSGSRTGCARSGQSLDILGDRRADPAVRAADRPDGAGAGRRGRRCRFRGRSPAPRRPVPHYRFARVFRKAQELVDKLRQSGADLLSVLERRDAEELGLLQSRQEGVILGLTRGIKEAEVRIAAERLEELRAARSGTADRIAQFTKQIADGPSALQKEQMAMMTRGRDAHFASAGLKIAAAIAKAAPQVKVGPFILGFEIGGDEVGGALDTAAEVSECFGEAFSMAGELLGVQAEVERAAEDWEQQLATARSDLAQIEHQVAGAEQQLAVAERELEIAGAADRAPGGRGDVPEEQVRQRRALPLDGRAAGRAVLRGLRPGLRDGPGRPSGRSGSSGASPTTRSRSSARPTGRAAAAGCSRARPWAWTSSGSARRAFDGDARGLEITKRVSLPSSTRSRCCGCGTPATASSR